MKISVRGETGVVVKMEGQFDPETMDILQYSVEIRAGEDKYIFFERVLPKEIKVI